MGEDGKKSLKFRQSKGDNSSITHDILMKFHVRNPTMVIYNPTMVIYIQYKSQEISFIWLRTEKIIEIKANKG